MYNKHTKAWFAVPLRVPKTYEYIPTLQERVLQTRVDTPGPLSQPAVRKPADPHNICRTLASTTPPHLAEIVQHQKLRMQ